MSKRLVKGKSLLLAVLFCYIFHAAIGQQELNFTALTTRHGLSSNSINVILKDHHGLMWFGTADGLDKFDGTNFTIYHHDAQDSTSIPANEVLSMYEDRSGRIWVGTGDGGIAYYDYLHNSFVRYKNDKARPFIHNASVRAMCEDHNNNMWIASYGNGLVMVNPNNSKISKAILDHTIAGQPNSFAIVSLFEDSRRRMWIGTNCGLYLYNWKSGKCTLFFHNETDHSSLSNNIVKSIAEDIHGNLWIGTFGGLNRLMPDGKSFESFRHAKADPTSISSDNIYSVVPAADDKLWLGTEEGLNIFDLKKSTAVTFAPDQRNIFSLTNKSVRSIYIDKNGLSWIGTFQGGINKYDPNLALFNLKQSNVFDLNGLTCPVVTSFAEYKNGNIFVGTDDGGLQLFNRSNGLFRHYDIKSALNKSGHRLSILTLKLDRTGKLWIGTFQQGLFQLEPNTGTYKQFLSGNKAGDINGNDFFA
jgi:ligand-binding sensor domain-containing protein